MTVSDRVRAKRCRRTRGAERLDLPHSRTDSPCCRTGWCGDCRKTSHRAQRHRWRPAPLIGLEGRAHFRHHLRNIDFHVGSPDFFNGRDGCSAQSRTNVTPMGAKRSCGTALAGLLAPDRDRATASHPRGGFGAATAPACLQGMRDAQSHVLAPGGGNDLNPDRQRRQRHRHGHDRQPMNEIGWV